jgi:hypothetical protein
VPLSQAQVPTIIASSLVCFVAGAALGGVVMFYLGYDPSKNRLTGGGGESQEGSTPEGPPPGMGGKGGGGPPMGKGGGGPPMGKGGGGPPGGMEGARGGPASNKSQLAALVTKLDQLTSKPLALKLTEKQSAELAKQLEGLDAEKGVSEAEAKRRLDAILEIVKGDKETLEAAGFRWPGEMQWPPPADNPFSDDEAKEHLKKLQERVKGAKPT